MEEKHISQNLLQAINEISERIYVSDIETYELLYINDIIKNEFHLGNYKGKKCYEILQGLDVPCPFCTNKYLKPNENYTWEYTNPLVNRTFSIKDLLIDWDNRPARLEIAFDITQLRDKQRSLQNALEIHSTILNCIKLLYREDNVNFSLDSIIAEIGAYLHAERAYLFEIESEGMYNTYEWCAPGIASQKNNLQAMNASLIDIWLQALTHGKSIIIEDTSSVPQPILKQVLTKQQIDRLVISPLQSQDKLIGYFGVDNPPAEKLQDIADLLDALRYFIMVTLQRGKDAKLLKHLSLHDSLTGLYNRNKYIMDLQNFTNRPLSMGIVFADINGLKSTNDRYGHRRGDELIIACGQKLQLSFPSASIYRTGGDEFVILCPSVDKNSFLEYAALLRKEFEQDSFCKAAVGWHWAEQTSSLEQLVSLADQEMYRNKQYFYKHRMSPDLTSSHIIE